MYLRYALTFETSQENRVSTSYTAQDIFIDTVEGSVRANYTANLETMNDGEPFSTNNVLSLLINATSLTSTGSTVTLVGTRTVNASIDTTVSPTSDTNQYLLNFSAKGEGQSISKRFVVERMTASTCSVVSVD